MPLVAGLGMLIHTKSRRTFIILVFLKFPHVEDGVNLFIQWIVRTEVGQILKIPKIILLQQ